MEITTVVVERVMSSGNYILIGILIAVFAYALFLCIIYVMSDKLKWLMIGIIYMRFRN